MTVRINKQKINLREKLAGVEDKVNFDEVVRGLGEYGGNVGIGTTNPGAKLHVRAEHSNSSSGIDNLLVLESFEKTGQDLQPNDGLGILFKVPVDPTTSAVGARIAAVKEGGTENATSTELVFEVSQQDETLDEAMRIDRDGNVGIDTKTPDVKLEVNGGDDDSEVFRGRSDGGNGNNARFSLKAFADGDDSYGGGLKIQTRDNLNVFHDRLTIKQDGNVGIGTTNPISSAKLEVQGDSNGAAGIGVRHTGATAGNLWRMYMRNDSDLVISSPVSVGVQLGYGQTSWSAESDESLKDNISELGLVLDKVKNYRCINYSLISNEMTEANAVGFIAQDWESDFPNIVSSDEDGKLSMKYTETIPVLLKAIQEQQQIIDQLKSRIETLEQQ
jgi:hypothetical protein